MRKDITIKKLMKAMNSKGFAVFENDNKSHNLNIVGIRATQGKPNKFDDVLCVFWKHEGFWNLLQFPMTADAGVHWLENPLNNSGCAILKEGQYKGAYKLRKHQGKYMALCQSGNVTVFRDNDKDSEHDMDPNKTETGMFGINIHRANAKSESSQVDRWSAGCQVLQNPHDFNTFIKICSEASTIWDNSFTYTLLKEEWL